jgi:hypothetical protein
MSLPAYQYYRAKPKPFLDPWYARICPNYMRIKPNDASNPLPPGYEFGIKFDTVTVNVPVYLKFLMDLFLSLGGKVIKKEVNGLDEAARLVKGTDVLVNCAGIGKVETAFRTITFELLGLILTGEIGCNRCKNSGWSIGLQCLSNAWSNDSGSRTASQTNSHDRRCFRGIQT